MEYYKGWIDYGPIFDLIQDGKAIFYGNVGIGTSNPTEKLEVQGNILASGTVTGSSDRRLKRNIRPIEEALKKLDSITGVKYFWIEPEKHNSGEQIGVIAQDVEKVFPQAVLTNGDGFKSVSYMALVAPVIQAIKELHYKFKAVVARVLGLEQDLLLVKSESKILKEKVNEFEANNKILERENLEIKNRLKKLEAQFLQKK